MPYTDIAPEDLILLAAEFVGRGLEIPQEVVGALGPDLTADILNPETQHGRTTGYAKPAHK